MGCYSKREESSSGGRYNNWLLHGCWMKTIPREAGDTALKNYLTKLVLCKRMRTAVLSTFVANVDPFNAQDFVWAPVHLLGYMSCSDSFI